MPKPIAGFILRDEARAWSVSFFRRPLGSIRGLPCQSPLLVCFFLSPSAWLDVRLARFLGPRELVFPSDLGAGCGPVSSFVGLCSGVCGLWPRVAFRWVCAAACVAVPILRGRVVLSIFGSWLGTFRSDG